MIRIVALICGLICGTGLLVSDMYQPELLRALIYPDGAWFPLLGIGLGVAITVASLISVLARFFALSADSTLCPQGQGFKPLAGAVLFGIGWGLAGYVPLTALVSSGLFSQGAAVFLMSVLAGMVISDVITRSRDPKRERPRSRG